ncbi:MAG: hypothetical protein IPM29_00305 [Planctomycetes bacterium]|nr:hypothetical protein [Planctomycetota bacterium]
MPIPARLEGPRLPQVLPRWNDVNELRVPGGSAVRTTTLSGVICAADLDGMPELELEFDRQEALASTRAGPEAGLLGPALDARFGLWATSLITGRAHDPGAVSVRLVGRQSRSRWTRVSRCRSRSAIARACRAALP